MASAFGAGHCARRPHREQLVQRIVHSAEYRSDRLQELYQQLLHHDADPTGLNFFMAFLDRGGTTEEVAAAIAGSPEYFQVRGGGTNTGFLNALYQDALGRALDPTAGRAGARRWPQAPCVATWRP